MCLCLTDLWASPRWRPCCLPCWAVVPTSQALWASVAAQIAPSPTRPSFHCGWTSSGQQGTWDQHKHVFKWEQDEPRDTVAQCYLPLGEWIYHDRSETESNQTPFSLLNNKQIECWRIINAQFFQSKELELGQKGASNKELTVLLQVTGLLCMFSFP